MSNDIARRGLMLVLSSPSGAGKTTLLSLLGGLDRADAGNIKIPGQEARALNGREVDRFLQRPVGWVFQPSGLLPLLTATENVAISLRSLGTPAAEAMDAARRALISSEFTAGQSGPATINALPSCSRAGTRRLPAPAGGDGPPARDDVALAPP